MAYQYQLQPHLLAHQYPLLDQQYNPSETLRSFANAVFNYLDMYHEPKGTQVLESDKMRALVSYMVPREHVEVSLKVSSLACSATFLAFQIETVFTSQGPAATRTGFLTFLRSEIMGDPEESFRNFNAMNQVMRLGPPFDRSQFPLMPEPRAKELSAFVQTSVEKTLKDLGWSPVAGGGSSSQEAARLHHQEQQNILTNMKVQMATNQMARMSASVGAMGKVGINSCYYCGRYSCNC